MPDKCQVKYAGLWLLMQKHHPWLPLEYSSLSFIFGPELFWPPSVSVAPSLYCLLGILGSCLRWRGEHQNKVKDKSLLLILQHQYPKLGLAFFIPSIQSKSHPPTHISPSHIFKAFLDLKIFRGVCSVDRSTSRLSYKKAPIKIKPSWHLDARLVNSTLCWFLFSSIWFCRDFCVLWDALIFVQIGNVIFPSPLYSQSVVKYILSEYKSSRQDIAFVLEAISTQMIEKFINLIPDS